MSAPQPGRPAVARWWCEVLDQYPLEVEGIGEPVIYQMTLNPVRTVDDHSVRLFAFCFFDAATPPLLFVAGVGWYEWSGGVKGPRFKIGSFEELNDLVVRTDHVEESKNPERVPQIR